jgi:hypothetical protein
MSDKGVQTPDADVGSRAGGKNTVWDDSLEVIKELPWGVDRTLVFIARS